MLIADPYLRNSWHQLLRKFLAGPSEMITHQILRMPNGSLIARYTKIIFTFFQSGLLHAIIDYSAGMNWDDSGSLRFFCMQALGIMLEDVVQAIYRYVSGTKRCS